MESDLASVRSIILTDDFFDSGPNGVEYMYFEYEFGASMDVFMNTTEYSCTIYCTVYPTLDFLNYTSMPLHKPCPSFSM